MIDQATLVSFLELFSTGVVAGLFISTAVSLIGLVVGYCYRLFLK